MSITSFPMRNFDRLTAHTIDFDVAQLSASAEVDVREEECCHPHMQSVVPWRRGGTPAHFGFARVTQQCIVTEDPKFSRTYAPDRIVTPSPIYALERMTAPGSTTAVGAMNMGPSATYAPSITVPSTTRSSPSNVSSSVSRLASSDHTSCVSARRVSPRPPVTAKKSSRAAVYKRAPSFVFTGPAFNSFVRPTSITAGRSRCALFSLLIAARKPAVKALFSPGLTPIVAEPSAETGEMVMPPSQIAYALSCSSSALPRTRTSRGKDRCFSATRSTNSNSVSGLSASTSPKAAQRWLSSANVQT